MLRRTRIALYNRLFAWSIINRCLDVGGKILLWGKGLKNKWKKTLCKKDWPFADVNTVITVGYNKPGEQGTKILPLTFCVLFNKHLTVPRYVHKTWISYHNHGRGATIQRTIKWGEDHSMTRIQLVKKGLFDVETKIFFWKSHTHSKVLTTKIKGIPIVYKTCI